MYVKHVLSWILYYHGMHIVQKVRTANHLFQVISKIICIVIRVTYSNINIFTLQEWNIKEPAHYITYIVLLISLTFNIFIFCYIGELVAEQV